MTPTGRSPITQRRCAGGHSAPFSECYSLAVSMPGLEIMRRREFLGTLGGAAAWRLAALAQQLALSSVDFLSVSSAGD